MPPVSKISYCFQPLHSVPPLTTSPVSPYTFCEDKVTSSLLTNLFMSQLTLQSPPLSSNKTLSLPRWPGLRYLFSDFPTTTKRDDTQTPDDYSPSLTVLWANIFQILNSLFTPSWSPFSASPPPLWFTSFDSPTFSLRMLPMYGLTGAFQSIECRLPQNAFRP